MFGKSLVFLGVVLLGASMLSGCGGSAAKSTSVSVASTAATVDAADSVTLTANVDNDKTSAGVSWSLNGGGVLSNETTTSAVYTAPAASSSPVTVTATATSIADTSKTGSVTLTVPAALSITTTASQLASSVGAAYRVTLAGSGGISPYTWTATGLPSCLTLNTATGVLSGTILAGCAGTGTPTFTMTDSGTATAMTASAQLNLVIASAPAIGFSGSMPSTATYNAAYSGSAAASGGVAGSTLAYSQSGTWPTWLSLNSGTGAVSGTPMAIGPNSFSVQAADAYGDTAIQSYTITVGPATPTISISNLPSSGVYGGGFTPAFANNGNGADSVASNTTNICTVSGGAVKYVGVGSCSLTASAAATTDYAAATSTATVAINPATPAITTQPAASAITYGSALSASTMSGGVASVSGAFAWTTPTTIPAAGSETEGFTFTPANTADYTSATGTVLVAVNEAALTITASSASVSYGASVPAISASYSGFVNGDTSSSLTAAPTCTTKYTTASSIGSYSTSCSGAVDGNYSFAYVAGTVTVSKATPAITVPPTASTISYGSALSSSTLSGGVASVSGAFAWTTPATVPATGSQTEGFTFTPTDTTDYNTVTGMVSVSVGKATPTITSWPTASGLTYGPTLGSSALTGGGASVSGTFAWTTPGVVPVAGTLSYSVTFTPTDTTDYSTVTGTVGLTVSKATPSISAWPAGSSLTYGQTLTASTLSGGASTPAGSFAWTTPGMVPVAGTQSYSVTFTPTDTTDYNTMTGTASVTINKATSIVSAWPAASGIASGQTLASSALSGGASTPAGSFAWTTPGTVPGMGTQSYSVTFTPTDTTDYTTLAGMVSVSVDKTTPTISSWPTASGLTYGPTLGSSALTGGSASVSGTFAWTTPGMVPVAGILSYSVTFTPTDTTDYSTVTGTVGLTVSKATPSISAWPAGSSLTYGQTLAASTLSGGASTPAGSFTWTTPGTVPSTGTATYSVTFTPTDTTDYNTLTGTGSVTINKATSIVSAWPAASSIASGQTLASSTLSGGASTPAGSFTWTTPGTVPGVGTQSYSVTFTPTDTTDYTTLAGMVSVTVNKATPSISAWPVASGLTYGQTLAASTLTGGASTAAGSFAWTTPGTAPNAGTTSYSVTFTPTDTTDYSTVTGSASVAIGPATLTVTASSVNVTVGSPVPTITPVYSGFENGDTPAVVTTAPTCSTTYTPTSAVGSTLPTNCSLGVVNSNYVFNYVSGTVNVVAMSITTSPTLPTGYVNSPYPAITLAVSGGVAPYSWAVSSGNPPAGLGLNTSTGVISGTPSGPAGTTSFAISVADSAQNTARLPFSITIAAGITITTASTLTPGVQGTAYPGETLAATGGAGAYSWTWAAGAGSSIPSGMTLNKSTGAINGTPGVSGTFSIVVTAIDAASNTAATTFSLTVYPPFSITTAALPGGTVNATYTSTQLAATGGSGNYTWSWTAAAGSSLPAGMTFSPGGVLAGTPTTHGSYSVVIKVKDLTLNVTSSTTFPIAIAYAPLSFTTSVLPTGTVNTAYTSTQFAAAGGSGSYSWSWAAASGSSLPGGMSFSPSGMLSGTPGAVGSYLVQVTVTDATASTSLTATFTVDIDSTGFSITTANPLPIDYVGSAYSKTLAASGGSGTGRTWKVSSGSLPAGLSLTGAEIIGTPTVIGSYSFTIEVTDSAANHAWATFSLSVAPVLTIMTTSPLPSGTVGVAYSELLSASGGSGNYSWSVSSGSLPAGLSLDSSSGSISGTPTTAGSYPLSLMVTDTSVSDKSASAPFSFTIAVAPVSVSGQISLVNNCAGAASVPLIAVTLTSNTDASALPVTVTTDSNGNYSFTNVPADSYTITPAVDPPASGTVPSSVFYPVSQTATVSSSSLTGENFSVALGYSVSGNAAYSGAQSGQIYLLLSAPNCGSGGALGTSIANSGNGGSFTINGVAPGTYTLEAWMDNQGNGIPNVINPTGSSSSLPVVNDLVNNAAVTLGDPTLPAVSSATPGPILNLVSPTDQGVVINFSPVTSVNVEAVTSYQVQWSTSPSFTGVTDIYSFAANGNRGQWILNNGLTGFSGTLSNGNTYYFRACGVLAGNSTAWSAASGPITVGAPSSGSNVQGTVSLPTNNTSNGNPITSYGPLYVGFYDQGTGAVYADRIASPSSPQPYSVNLPDGANYIFFAILDQNNDGLIDTGDISYLNGGYTSPLAISGDTTLSQYDLAATSSTAAATTQMTQSTDIHGNSTTSYGLNLQLLGGIKLPVTVELSGPSYAYLIAPVDFSACTSCGNPQFDYQPSIASGVPTVNDNFPLQVTYSDGTTDAAVYAQVSGVGATATDPDNGVETTVAASGLQLSGSATMPDFSWIDPNNAGNYIYSFTLSDSNGNILWQIPSSNSHLNGFDSSISLINWGIDPTGNADNTPTVSSLTSGAVYTWSIAVVDSNGNSSRTQVSFKP